MQINSEETEIIGHWNFDGSKMTADENCTRIELLRSNYLIKITADYSGWEVLYKDPFDNRYWESTYPKSEMHGGGPPALICLTESKAKSKYHFTT